MFPVLKCKIQNYKAFRKNIGETIRNLELGRVLRFGMRHKTKIDKLDLIKIINFSSLKGSFKKMKR